MRMQCGSLGPAVMQCYISIMHLKLMLACLCHACMAGVMHVTIARTPIEGLNDSMI